MKPIIVFLLCLVTFAAGAVSPDKLPSDTLVARADRMIARGESRDSALLYLSVVARRYYADPGDTRLHPVAIEAMRHLGNLYMSTYNDYGKAYEYIAQGIQLAEEEDLPQQLPYLYTSMANLWNANNLVRNKGNDKTNEYIRRAFATAIKHKNIEAIPVVAVNMAILGHSNKDFDKELSEFAKMKYPEAIPLLDFARLYVAGVQASKRKAYTKSARLFHHAVEAVPQGYYQERYTITAALREAEALEAGGDPRGARNLLLRYLDYAKARGLTDFILTLYGSLAFNYDRAGMDDSASVYEYKWLVEREKLRQQNLPDMNETAFVNQIDRVNSELKQMSIKRQQRERQLIVVCFAGILAIVIAGAMAHAWRAQRRKTRELFQQNQRLLNTPEPKAQTQEATTKGKYENSGMDAEMSAMLYQELIRVLATSPQIYTPGFSLETLAELIGAKSRLVSQAINENAGVSFSQLLADYRIREACRRLTDMSYANQTVEGIANSVGIMSRTTFTQTFKRITGLTPAQYRREAASQAS